jgi:phospholipase/carboxylesterase
VEQIKELIGEEVKRVGSASKVFLGGFSQGGTVALSTYLDYDGELGGVVVASGGHFGVHDLSKIDLAKKKKTPLFMHHGTADEIFPLKVVKKSYQDLTDGGLNHFKMTVEEGGVHSMGVNSMDEI